MSVVYNNDVKDDRLTEVLSAIDADASPATVELLDGSSNVLAIFTLPQPAGAVSGQALTFDCTPAISTVGEAAAGEGTDAVAARIKDGAGTVVISGLTAGEGSEDVVLDNSKIAEGQTVTLNSAVIAHG